jgi:hypothetical protein
MELAVAVAVAVAEARRQFENPEEGVRQPLEAYRPLLSNGSDDVTANLSVCNNIRTTLQN